MAATEEQISALAYKVASVDGERTQFREELKIQLEIDLETHKMAQKAWEEAVEWSLS
jgi:hypothetical protein